MGSTAATVTLRAALPEDAAQIADIWRTGWHDGHDGRVPVALVEVRTDESFRSRAAERIADTVVALVDGAVAGFVMVVEDEVEQVYVATAHRGAGVADALMREAEQRVRANGFTEAWLAVVAENTRARAFYERAGWADDGAFDYVTETERGAIAVPCRRYTKAV